MAAPSLEDRVRTKLKMRVAEFMNGSANGASSTANLRALKDRLAQILQGLSSDEHRALHISRTGEQERFVDDFLAEILGVGPLDALLKDPTISEIMVNGPSEIFVERNGRLQRTESRFRDENHLRVTIERMLNPLGLSVSESSPLCDASLPDGTRINVIIPPLVMDGPVVTIRRTLRRWAMREVVELSSLSPEAAEFLEGCVRARVNMVFSGGTSTGKTTLVAILSEAIPAQERIVTIENVPELELPQRAHWIRLVGKAANLEGRGEVPLRTLVKNALRMRPDRIILGEARGGEALDVVQAMHSGHDGFMTVLHANSPVAALERLQTLMQMSGLDIPPAACGTQIASAVDLIVHLARFIDGSRRIAAISHVLGFSPSGGFEVEDLFTLDAAGFSPEGQLQGTCRYAGVTPKFLKKFALNNVQVPAWVKG